MTDLFARPTSVPPEITLANITEALGLPEGAHGDDVLLAVRALTRAPARVTRLGTAVEQRFVSRLVVTSSGCWEFDGSRRKGYGRFSIGGRLYSAHRVAAALWLGLDLHDLSIKTCHHCDNRPCCNPAHLFLGTQIDNMADASRKGRLRREYAPRVTVHPRRRRCAVCDAEYEPDVDRRGRSRVCSAPCATAARARTIAAARPTVLTPELVRSIRADLQRSAGVRGAGRQIAARYGVSSVTISNINTGKRWAHVQ